MNKTNVPEKFLKPFRKVFVSQVNEGWMEGDVLMVRLDSDTVLDCHMVWLQGRVESVSAARDKFILRDVDGKQISVSNFSASPGGGGWVELGLYVQVIGQIVQDVQQHRSVKSTKVCDLSSKPHEQSMWEVEVKELQNLLKQKIKIVV